ncbi:hypothetical protein Tco_0009360 [Tanacetum coccineum]
MHMLTPKPSSYYTGLGKSSFANPLYLKQAQKEKLCLCNIKYDKNDLANLFAPESKETLILAEESRSKLCKNKVKPYDYTKQNSLYKIFTSQTEKSREQLFFANEVRRNIFRKSFQKQTTNLTKRIEYLPTKASMGPKVDELQTDKTELSKEYDLLLQECVSKDIMCSILRSFKSLDEKTELQCFYLEKVKECECLANELSKRTENVCKQDYNELSKSFSKLKQHSISLELALQQCQEQLKNDNV